MKIRDRISIIFHSNWKFIEKIKLEEKSYRFRVCLLFLKIQKDFCFVSFKRILRIFLDFVSKKKKKYYLIFFFFCVVFFYLKIKAIEKVWRIMIAFVFFLIVFEDFFVCSILFGAKRISEYSKTFPKIISLTKKKKQIPIFQIKGVEICFEI